MKNIFNFSTAVFLCLAMFGLGSCRSIQELDTDQFSDSQVVLSAYGPNPVYRDGSISFIGSNLDRVASVEVPGIDPITTIEVVKSGKNSEIKIQLTNTTEAVGRITLITKDGVKLTTKSDITYTEPIVFDDFSPKEAMPGDVITIKGDYMNLVQEVIFTDNVIVAGEALTKTRSELKVTVPSNAITGTIAVGDVDQILDPEAFANTKVSKDNLIIGDPTVTANAAATLKAGDEITVAGKYLDMIKSIEFDGASVTSFKQEGGTKITFNLPAEAKDGEYNLVSYAGKSFKGGEFTSVKPEELAAAPQPVKAWEELTITGKNLDLVNKVEVPGAGEVVFVNDGDIKFTMPGTATEGDVTLTMANGSAVTVPFTLVIPTITAVSPLEIYAGDGIDVTGTDLDLTTSVTLGGKELSFIMAQDGSALKLTSSATSVSGKVEITLANGVKVASADEVTVNYHSKVIVTEIPAAQHIGQTVNIKGANLKLVENIFIGDTKVTDYGLRTDEQIVFAMPWMKVGSYPVKFHLFDGDDEVQPEPIEVQLEQDIKTIWEGEFAVGGWERGFGNLSWGGYDWSTVKKGTELRVYYTIDPAGDYHQIRIANGSWAALPGSKRAYPSADADGNIPISEDGFIAFNLADDDLNELVNNGGLVVCAAWFKVTKVQLITEISQEKTLWEGTCDLAGWSLNWQIGDGTAGADNPRMFVDCGLKAGDEIRIYGTFADWWQLQFFDGHWNGQSEIGVATGANNGNNLNPNVYSVTNGYVKIPVTETLATQLTTLIDWGYCWIMQGEGSVITKIAVL